MAYILIVQTCNPVFFKIPVRNLGLYVATKLKKREHCRCSVSLPFLSFSRIVPLDSEDSLYFVKTVRELNKSVKG